MLLSCAQKWTAKPWCSAVLALVPEDGNYRSLSSLSKAGAAASVGYLWASVRDHYASQLHRGGGPVRRRLAGKALPGFRWLPGRHDGRPAGPRRRAARQHPVRLQRPRVRPRPRPGLREGVLRAYFDAVFAARRVRCPVEIRRAGLGDYVSPPSSLAVLYNALDVPKTITWNQGWTHGWSPSGMAKWTVHGGSDTIRAHD